MSDSVENSDSNNLLNQEVLNEIDKRVDEKIQESNKKLPPIVRVLNALLNAVVAKLIVKLGILFFGGLIILAPFCVTQVKDYELVMVHRWGSLKQTPVKPGLKWFWPIMDKVHRFDLRQKNITLTDRHDNSGIEGIDFETRDKYHAGFIASIHYTLDKSKGKVLVDAYGAKDSEETRKLIETRIEDEVRYSLQNLGPQYNLSDIIQNRAALIHNALFTMGFKKTSLTKKSDNLKSGIKDHLPDYQITIPGPMMDDERLPDLGIIIKYMRLEIYTPETYESKNKVELSLLELDDYEKNELKRAEIKSKSMEELKKGALIYFLDKWDGRLPESLILDDKFYELMKEEKVIRRIK
ncbi:SPFH domain-containing protein [uncultured Aquimarina sp.]|uniref:SPFH domain-containing protein n=1 Tax=uncultured Aquimarina sp. TaxID=575652 RepID=UPI00262C0494|nr:SPFH domain-containing protein [uncultured Aquimarina sp.]